MPRVVPLAIIGLVLAEPAAQACSAVGGLDEVVGITNGAAPSGGRVYVFAYGREVPRARFTPVGGAAIDLTVESLLDEGGFLDLLVHLPTLSPGTTGRFVVEEDHHGTRFEADVQLFSPDATAPFAPTVLGIRAHRGIFTDSCLGDIGDALEIALDADGRRYPDVLAYRLALADTGQVVAVRSADIRADLAIGFRAYARTLDDEPCFTLTAIDRGGNESTAMGCFALPPASPITPAPEISADDTSTATDDPGGCSATHPAPTKPPLAWIFLLAAAFFRRR